MPLYAGSISLLSSAGTTRKPANFDGTNDYLLRGAALTGISASVNLTGSFWFRRTATGVIEKVFSDNAAVPRLALRFDVANTFTIIGRETPGADTIVMQASTTSAVTDTNWHHVMFSRNGTTVNMYLDGVSNITITTNTNTAIGFATPINWAAGANTSGTEKFAGDLADLWLAPGVFVDLSQATNRNKFLNGRLPVDLGPNGENPTGTSPIVFLGGPLATWHVNKGTGGGFSVTGSLTAGQEPIELPASAVFAPDSISGLVFWYDVDLSTITLDGSNNVQEISDLSGSGNAGTQATASNRGPVLTNQFGSRSAIDVNDDWYGAGGATVLNAGTYFAVAKSDVDALGAIVGRGCNNNTTSGALLRFLNGLDISMIIGNGTARASTVLVDSYTIGSTTRAIGRWDASTVDLNVNGVSATQSTHSLGSLGTSGVRVAGGVTSHLTDGKWGAAGYYNRRLTDLEVTNLMDYLQSRFG